MWILVYSWIVTLTSVAAYLSRFQWSAYFLSFAPRPLHSRILNSIKENKSFNFLHNIIHSMLPTFLLSTAKQISLPWLCQTVFHAITSILVLFCYWLLKYIKSIIYIVVFKITNDSVGHLYNFSDFVWWKGEQSNIAQNQ